MKWKVNPSEVFSSIMRHDIRITACGTTDDPRIIPVAIGSLLQVLYHTTARWHIDSDAAECLKTTRQEVHKLALSEYCQKYCSFRCIKAASSNHLELHPHDHPYEGE